MAPGGLSILGWGGCVANPIGIGKSERMIKKAPIPIVFSILNISPRRLQREPDVNTK